MLLSLEKNFLFVHVSKTAGTSVEYMLKTFATQPDRRKLNVYRCKLGLQRDVNHLILKQHDTLLTAKKRMPATVFAQVYKFAFVRNPWDWMVSLYCYLQRKHDHRHQARVAKMCFEEYIEFEIARNKRSQAEFLVDTSGQLLTDYVGRFESLAHDFNHICQHLRLTELHLAHRNKTQHRPYTSYYSPRTQRLVAQHWAQDIELFQYQYDASTRIYIAPPPITSQLAPA